MCPATHLSHGHATADSPNLTPPPFDATPSHRHPPTRTDLNKLPLTEQSNGPPIHYEAHIKTVAKPILSDGTFRAKMNVQETGRHFEIYSEIPDGYSPTKVVPVD